MFSRHTISPGFIALITASARWPTQSSTKPTGRPRTSESLAATGLSESFGSRPFGRPKCESRMTLPPLSAISRMVGATRSSRVASVTWPFSVGTLRSSRSSTRLSRRSASSRVRKLLLMIRHDPPKVIRGQSSFYVCRRALSLFPCARTGKGCRQISAAGTANRATGLLPWSLRSACPSRPPCRPCGWRSPTRCRTRTSRARNCRPSPWSGPCGRPRNADRG